MATRGINVNLGVVTLNLPYVALESKKDKKDFWLLLDQRLELCHKALQVRYKRLENVTTDVAPLLWQHGAFARMGKGEKLKDIIHGGYASISLGYVGMFETVKALKGVSHTTDEGHELAEKILDFINSKLEKWSKEDDVAYGLYGTPEESTTYKFAKALQKEFGVIEGITDKNYVMNSYHVDITEPIDPFTKLIQEGKLQSKTLGGAISYIECGDLTKNVPAVLEVLKCIYENTIYAELNIKSDYCSCCGFSGEIKLDEDLNWYCPNCGNTDKDKMNVARRTCGYIGTNYWNKGRTEEISKRYVHLDDVEL